MEEDVNRVSAVDMEVPRRVANQLSIEEKQKLMEYYSKQLEMMYPIASPGMTDTYSGAYPFTFRQPIKHKIAFKSTILYPFIP